MYSVFNSNVYRFGNVQKQIVGISSDLERQTDDFLNAAQTKLANHGRETALELAELSIYVGLDHTTTLLIIFYAIYHRLLLFKTNRLDGIHVALERDEYLLEFGIELHQPTRFVALARTVQVLDKHRYRLYELESVIA